MPLVRITARDTRSADTLDALGNAVHDALVETMKVPPEDRFQVRARVPAGDLVADEQYLGIDRRDPVIVEVTLRAGRTDAMKRSFYARTAEFAAERAAIRPADLVIVLRENDLADWSFGEGLAQYAPVP